MTAVSTSAVDVQVVATARGPVEVARVGRGPAVVAVHGIPGSWRQAVPLALDLAGDFEVLLPSRPGYGTTPLATGRSPADQADAYAALLDALGLGAAAVVGISGGGPSSLAFAQRHPGRTRALVLCCAVAAHLIEAPLGMRIAALPGVGEVASGLARWSGRRRIRRAEAVDRAIRRGLTPDEQARAEDPAVRADLVGFLRSHLDAPAGLAGLRNDLRHLGARAGGPSSAPPGTGRVPALVLHGDADEVVPLAHAEYHAAALPGAGLEVYEQAGHLFLLTRRAEVSARIRSVLLDAARGR